LESVGEGKREEQRRGRRRIGGAKQWSSKEAERTKGQKAKDRMRVGGRAR
jgi:hypothetical protein